MRVGELNAVLKLDGKNQFDRDVDSSGRKFQNLATVARGAGQAMATTTVAAGAAMVGLGAAVFKTGVDYNAQMDLLDDFARNSPFAKDVFIRAQQQLIGFGIAAEDVIPTRDCGGDAWPDWRGR